MCVCGGERERDSDCDIVERAVTGESTGLCVSTVMVSTVMVSHCLQRGGVCKESARLLCFG